MPRRSYPRNWADPRKTDPALADGESEDRPAPVVGSDRNWDRVAYTRQLGQAAGRSKVREDRRLEKHLVKDTQAEEHTRRVHKGKGDGEEQGREGSVYAVPVAEYPAAGVEFALGILGRKPGM